MSDKRVDLLVTVAHGFRPLTEGYQPQLMVAQGSKGGQTLDAPHGGQYQPSSPPSGGSSAAKPVAKS